MSLATLDMVDCEAEVERAVRRVASAWEKWRHGEFISEQKYPTEE